MVPEFIEPVFTKTSPKRSFSVIQNERFGLVFAKTGSIISGMGEKRANVRGKVEQGSQEQEKRVREWERKGRM